jgi:lipid-binding SYLF domain-containing protein
LFAGVALKGSTLRSDDSDNKKLYGKEVRHEDVLTGKVPAPAAAKPLLDTISKYSVAEKK